MRLKIIRSARIEKVGKSQSCMVSKLRIIWKQTVPTSRVDDGSVFEVEIMPFENGDFGFSLSDMVNGEIVVTQVHDGSSAMQLGVQQGDVVVQMAGVTIRGAEDPEQNLKRAMEEAEARMEQGYGVPFCFFHSYGCVSI